MPFNQLDPAKLDNVAFEWDPTPFIAAVEQMGTADLIPQMNPAAMGNPEGGAMDQSGSSNRPGVPATAGMDYNSVFAGTPTQKPMSGAGLGAAAGMMAPPPPQQMAPGAAPRKAPAMGKPLPGFPPTPHQAKVPTLAELLRGR